MGFCNTIISSSNLINEIHIIFLMHIRKLQHNKYVIPFIKKTYFFIGLKKTQPYLSEPMTFEILLLKIQSNFIEFCIGPKGCSDANVIKSEKVSSNENARERVEFSMQV